MESTLRIEYDDADKDYIVVLDCCEGCTAFGETKEEALLEFARALQGYMEVMIEDGAELKEG